MRASFAVTALVIALLFAIGCNQSISSPTPQPSVSALPSNSVTAGASSDLAPKLGTTALFDSTLDGSAYRLDGVSGTSLTFSNQTAGNLTIAYDSDTKFRRAVLQSWMPSDPYYQAALAYNTIATSDGSTLTALVGGNVRIVLAPSPIAIPVDPYVPPNPIRILSFQPIA